MWKYGRINIHQCRWQQVQSVEVTTAQVDKKRPANGRGREPWSWHRLEVREGPASWWSCSQHQTAADLGAACGRLRPAVSHLPAISCVKREVQAEQTAVNIWHGAVAACRSPGKWNESPPRLALLICHFHCTRMRLKVGLDRW